MMPIYEFYANFRIANPYLQFADWHCIRNIGITYYVCFETFSMIPTIASVMTSAVPP